MILEKRVQMALNDLVQALGQHDVIPDIEYGHACHVVATWVYDDWLLVANLSPGDRVTYIKMYHRGPDGGSLLVQG
jgi:hypothetical protein